MNINKSIPFGMNCYFTICDLKPDLRTEYKFDTLVALDLQSYLRLSMKSRSQHSLSYLDIHIPEKIQEDFSESVYLDCLDFCLNLFFTEFEIHLYELLKSHIGISFNGTLYTLLLEIPATEFSHYIIYRFLVAFTKTVRFIFDGQAVVLFDKISTILFEKKYQYPYLAARLLKAICYMNILPDDVYFVRPAAKFDYVLYNTKFYYFMYGMEHYFRDFRKNNSISVCLQAGRFDVLQIMLEYGHWREFSESDLYEWIYHCFEDISVDIMRYLRTEKYNLRRYILILQLYYAYAVPVRKRKRYVSTMKLFWESIPDTYVTAKEMYQVIRGITPFSYKAGVKRVCTIYKRALNSEPSQPRSLKQYARCAIRSALDFNCTLPESISFLDIPDSCRTYLRLK